MSSVYRRKYNELAKSQTNGGVVKDLTSHWYNIDTVFDSIVEEETLRGKEPSLELAVYDLDSGEKYHRFRRRSEEEEERYQLSKNGAPVKEKEKPISESGKEEWEAVHGEKEEEHIYLCEWCNKLGYQKKYNPEYCDTCDMCATCDEYEAYECSGCSYSRYRTGKLYSERVPIDDILNNEDRATFMEVRGSQCDDADECFIYNGDFSIKDF